MNRVSGQCARGGVLVAAAALLVATIATAEAQVGTQPPAGLPSETINNPDGGARILGPAPAAGTTRPVAYQHHPLPHRNRLSALQLCRAGRHARRL